LYASGLVLLTPLAIEVQEDAVSGRVRATVKDQTTDKCAHDVHVKVIGSRNDDFVSGQTDLRGVFVADGIRGAVTVIAQAGPSRYAFYRAKGAAAEDAIGRLIAVGQPSPSASRRAGHPSVASISLTAGVEAEKIQDALDSPAILQFKEIQLSDVIASLKEAYKIEIQLDEKSLSEASITKETPITEDIKGISLRSALRLMLKKIGATYVIKDEVLLITTREEADNQLEAKVYPVADLVLPAGASAGTTGEGAQADFDSLIDLIETTIKPNSWQDNGGPGSISAFENGLSIVVSQTLEGHAETEAVLENLRKVMRDTGRKGLPASGHRSKKPVGGQGMGGGGGMGGGMGGGQGGMGGGTFGGANGAPSRGKSGASPSASQQPDLLQGVQEMNKGFQGKQSEKLQKMYKDGKGGVEAGGAF
jgi:hypothetical protein